MAFYGKHISSKSITPKPSAILNCDIDFDGIVSPHICAKLILEMIKYIMYQKEQIPVPFDQLKCLEISYSTSQDGDKLHSSMQKRGFPSTASIQLERKVSHAVQMMTDLFFNIEQVFSQNIYIKEISVILGATVMSPKNVYVIKLPKTYQSSKETPLSFRKCMTTLFRTIVMSNVFQDLKAVAITNVIVLLKAHRDSGLSWFIPKPTYKFVNRGHTVVFNLRTKSPAVDISLNISGMARRHLQVKSTNLSSDTGSLEHFFCSSEDSTATARKSNLLCCNNDSHTELMEMNICKKIENLKISDEKENDRKYFAQIPDSEDCFIWFQAPTIFKGFRDTSAKMADNGTTGMWF